MNFDFTDEQLMVRQMVRDFTANEVAPVAREYDLSCAFPHAIVQKVARLGMLAPTLPEEYGGAGLDHICEAIFFEEIGSADASLRTTLSVQISLCEQTILAWGSEGQKQRCLPRLASGEWLGCYGLTEPDAGSDASNLQTRALRDGDEWVLNGHKMWISNGSVAHLAIVFAQTDPALRHKGITAFLVETGTPGFQAVPIHGKLGMHASDTAELNLQDVRVPAENVLGKVGEGFKIAMTALDSGRYGVAAGSVGLIQACIDASTKYACERAAFGRLIGEFQLVQELIADMVLDYEAARLLVYRAGHLKNQGRPHTRETALAKWYASEAAVRAANNAIQVHGGYGYSDEFPVERYLRDARVGTLYEGTTQIQKLIIGRYATGMSAFH